MISQKSFRLTLGMLALVACGGAGGDGYGTSPTSSGNPPVTTPPVTTPPASPNTVNVANTAFNPTAVTVSKGTTVTWKWAVCTNDGSGDGYGGYGSNTCPTHNITFDDGSNIASQTLDSGEYTRTFTAAGTYKYHCSIHGAAVMSGQVVVQ